jgi:hypothetical protein
MKMAEYFKRSWDETRGDEFDSWGSSVWYFELDQEGYPVRQIELYENGNRLKYDSEKSFDDYGGLGDQALDLKEFQKYRIQEEEFETEWNRSNPKKEHQEILNLISDYLANNYDMRFGQALFNLGINEFVDKADPAKQNFQMRDIHGDSDESILERIRKKLQRR